MEHVMTTRHIVIADDHDNVRAFLVRMCSRLYPTATVTAVRNGAEALAAIQGQPVDLLVTNANMPIMHGLELIRALRARQNSIPILLLSADERLAEPGLAAGADRFLLKPPTLDELRQTLTELLPP
jgi:CheY-like chemotaxis protein